MQAKFARLFFALYPGSSTRSRLADIQSALQLQARPVAVSNLHMTLVFLGTVQSSRIASLHDIAAAMAFPDCELVLDLAGRFEKARIAWLGCKQVPPELSGFQLALAQQLQEAGFKIQNRGWTPHFTLYRNLRKPFETISFDAVKWRPAGFCLMESRHETCGLMYRPIGRWPEDSECYS